MKKFLALALSLLMVVAMVPMAFVSAADTAKVIEFTPTIDGVIEDGWGEVAFTDPGNAGKSLGETKVWLAYNATDFYVALEIKNTGGFANAPTQVFLAPASNNAGNTGSKGSLLLSYGEGDAEKTVSFTSSQEHASTWTNVFSNGAKAGKYNVAETTLVLEFSFPVTTTMQLDALESFVAAELGTQHTFSLGVRIQPQYFNHFFPITMEKAPAVIRPAYTVAAGSVASVELAQPVTVQFNTTDFNAGELTVAFDTEYLAYVPGTFAYVGGGTLADGVSATDNGDGTITIVDFGAAKSGFTLTFNTRKVGTTEVAVTEAAFGVSADAATNDLNDSVDLASATATVTITAEEFDVTFAEGDAQWFETLTQTEYEEGATVTLTLNDEKLVYYTYPAVITLNGVETAIVDGKVTFTINADTVVDIAAPTWTQRTVTLTGKVDGVVADNIADWTENFANVATGETAYVLTLADDVNASATAGYKFTIGTVTIGGVAYENGTFDDAANTYTIPAADITGDIAIEILKTTLAANRFSVTANGATASGNIVDGYANLNEAITFTVDVSDKAYAYTATLNGETVVLTAEGTYTVAITENLTFVVTKELIVNATAQLYLAQGENSIFLVTVTKADGADYTDRTFKYDTNNMFWSDTYTAFCYLVAGAEDADLAALAAGVADELAAEAAVNVDYTGNVNMSTYRDANDAQLVYDMINATYKLADLGVMKFLRADMNNEVGINLTDCAAIVTAILG